MLTIVQPQSAISGSLSPVIRWIQCLAVGEMIQIFKTGQLQKPNHRVKQDCAAEEHSRRVCGIAALPAELLSLILENLALMPLGAEDSGGYADVNCLQSLAGISSYTYGVPDQGMLRQHQEFWWRYLHEARHRNADPGLNDLLASPKRNLTAASLVSHTWRQLALPLLFYSVTFRYSPDIHHLITWHTERERDAAAIYPSFYENQNLTTLRTAFESHPQFFVYVQRLTLAAHCRPLGLYARHCHSCGPHYDIHLFQAMLSCLPRLRELTLLNVTFCCLPPASTPPQKLLDLETVNLYSRIPHACYTFAVLRSFGKVKKLRLSVSSDTSHHLQDGIIFKHLTVENLTLEYFATLDVYLDAILSSPTAHSLKSLQIDPVYPAAIPRIHSFLLQVSPSLIHLRYGLLFVQGVLVTTPRQSLPECIMPSWPKLETITLAFSMQSIERSDYSTRLSVSRYGWTCVVWFLDNLGRCPALRSVILAIQITDQSEEDLFALVTEVQAVEHALLRLDAAPDLLVVTADGRSLHHVHRRPLIIMMSTLHERGILRFE